MAIETELCGGIRKYAKLPQKCKKNNTFNRQVCPVSVFQLVSSAVQMYTYDYKLLGSYNRQFKTGSYKAEFDG